MRACVGGAQAPDRTDPSAAWTSRLIGVNSLHGDDDGGGVGDDGGGVDDDGGGGEDDGDGGGDGDDGGGDVDDDGGDGVDNVGISDE